MSRIGRLPIPVPSGVEVAITASEITVKGPKGSLTQSIVSPIAIEQGEGTLLVTRPSDDREARSRHGLVRSLVANMVTGVTDGYSKPMEIVGTGYRVVAQGDGLVFSLGFSHPVPIPAPEGIRFTVESPTKFSVSGIDKQKVGEVAANIRKLRKPDPYKGKGVRYAGEVIRRKAGKTGK